MIREDWIHLELPRIDKYIVKFSEIVWVQKLQQLYYINTDMWPTMVTYE